MSNDKVKIEVIQGPEGIAVTINDYRVAGPKPWGGGHVLASLKADPKEIRGLLPPAWPEPVVAKPASVAGPQPTWTEIGTIAAAISTLISGADLEHDLLVELASPLLRRLGIMHDQILLDPHGDSQP